MIEVWQALWAPLRPEEWSALLLSIDVSLRALALIAGPGVFLGYVFARHDFAGRSFCSAILHVPLVLPPVVVGYALLIVFAPQSSFAQFLPELAFHRNGAALASAIMGFPLLFRASRIAFEMADSRYEEAALCHGASRWLAFWKITLPLALFLRHRGS